MHNYVYEQWLSWRSGRAQGPEIDLHPSIAARHMHSRQHVASDRDTHKICKNLKSNIFSIFSRRICGEQFDSIVTVECIHQSSQKYRSRIKTRSVDKFLEITKTRIKKGIWPEKRSIWKNNKKNLRRKTFLDAIYIKSGEIIRRGRSIGLKNRKNKINFLIR